MSRLKQEREQQEQVIFRFIKEMYDAFYTDGSGMPGSLQELLKKRGVTLPIYVAMALTHHGIVEKAKDGRKTINYCALQESPRLSDAKLIYQEARDMKNKEKAEPREENQKSPDPVIELNYNTLLGENQRLIQENKLLKKLLKHYL